MSRKEKYKLNKKSAGYGTKPLKGGANGYDSKKAWSTFTDSCSCYPAAVG
jgi:hypothetical protein